VRGKYILDKSTGRKDTVGGYNSIRMDKSIKGISAIMKKEEKESKFTAIAICTLGSS